MKRILYLFFLLAMPVSYAGTKESETPFETVFNAISAPRILDSSFSELLRQLKGFCAESTDVSSKNGNVSCIKTAEVSFFDVVGTETSSITLIQSSFFGADKCGYIRDSLKKKLGKPNKVKGECDMEWRLKSGKKSMRHRYLGFEVNKAKDIIYFTIGEEQGP